MLHIRNIPKVINLKLTVKREIITKQMSTESEWNMYTEQGIILKYHYSARGLQYKGKRHNVEDAIVGIYLYASNNIVTKKLHS